MIDVIFAILVVFLITAPLMTQGVRVELPQADAPTVKEKKSLSISITSKRKIFIEDLPTTSKKFRRDFRARWNGNPETLVVLNADKKVPYGFVMQLMAIAQKEGAQKIGFLTEPRMKSK
jgi:biopolymer transport protein ExbD/biopolymer transport protein TolR